VNYPPYDTEEAKRLVEQDLRDSGPSWQIESARLLTTCLLVDKLKAELDAFLNPPEMFPFRPFVPKHAADCKDQNCDRSCMVTKVTP